ncbi:ABC transporter substrate-binding protein [Microvirga rosea]|uniref:ABC transporter substrate-binding protein n=1 Tax=Microvirga rosea TaxID=2715425 RepID=UPI001D0BBE6A|nr:ABC transporter substrate-binding protein [Microvirga rosea]MCB8823196.1 ABC transporter substrate-binding protein [Microvirga rosea]
MKTFKSALLATLACFFGVGAASATEKIRIGAPNPWQPYTSALIFGKKLGFFEEEQLDPEFVAVQGTAILVPQVANKTITFGLPNPDLLLVALDKNERFPVKLFYNAYTISPFEFVVREDSPINSIADLKGKKLGVGALSWGNIPILKSIMKDSGVEWMKDVAVMPVGLGPAAWRQLSSGQVEALSLFAHQHESMALAGTKIKRLPIPEKYKSLFSNGLIAHDDTIAQKPQLVEKMARVMAKSNFACRANLEGCVRAFWDYDSAAKPTAEKEAGYIASNVQLTKLDMDIVFGGAKEDRFGDYEPGAIKNLIDVMHQSGQLKRGDLNPDLFITREFVEGANRWDRTDVLRKAAK